MIFRPFLLRLPLPLRPPNNTTTHFDSYSAIFASCPATLLAISRCLSCSAIFCSFSIAAIFVSLSFFASSSLTALASKIFDLASSLKPVTFSTFCFFPLAIFAFA